MEFRVFVKTPLFWSIFLLFGVVFNYHAFDLGETYVSRNLSAWAVIFLSLIILWWRPFKRGELAWTPLWLGGLFLPAIGGLLVLVVNIWGGFEHFHVGHYFLPVILLTFGLFVLGLIQHQADFPSLDLIAIIVFIAFLPQYGTYLVTENPFFASLLPHSEISVSPSFYKASAGFGQYNLLGSFIATLLVLAAAAFVVQPLKPMRRMVLATIIVAITVDLPFVRSKTALLGVFLGIAGLAIHVFLRRPTRLSQRHLAIVSALLLVTYFSVLALANLLNIDDQLAARSFEANQSSFATRFTLWVIGFWGFTEKPLFGHGLGAYFSVYMDHFGRYGLAEGLTYLNLASIPHNLFIHILSEAGLFGLMVIMGPFIWLGLRIFSQNDNRWLLAALLFPILLHCQLEYPYIASGTHYWAFGVLLVVGHFSWPEAPKGMRHSVLADRRPVRAAYGAVSAFALIGIFVTASLTVDVRRSALSYIRAAGLPLAQFIEERANAPDLQHPILGERMRALTNLQLIRKIFAEQRFDLLRPIALPYFETHVLKRYPTLPVWKTAFEVYGVLGEHEKMEAIIVKMALYLPEEAEKFRLQYENYRRLRVSRPQ